MAVLKPKYADSAALTISLNVLANGSARESSAVDNTGNLYLDALVSVIAAMGAGTPGSDGLIYVWAYGSEDGTNYGDNATGSEGALTMRTPSNLRLIGTIAVPTASVTYKSQPMSVAAAFGGRMPRKWGIVVENKTNLAFSGSGCSASYTGVNLEDV